MSKVTIKNNAEYTYDSDMPIYQGINSKIFQGSDSHLSRFVAVKEISNSGLNKTIANLKCLKKQNGVGRIQGFVKKSV